LLGLLLLFSGAASLLHQTAWFRLLRPVLGVGVLPAACVSAGVLAGLAIGSLWGGRLVDRARRPGRVFAGAELAGAALGFLVPLALLLLGSLSGALAPLLRESVGLVLAVVLCTAGAIPMGMTLPAALRARDVGRAGAGASFRVLYGVNTLGAVVGVLLGSTWLLEALGNRGLAFAAAGIQLAVGACAWVLLRAPGLEAGGTAKAGDASEGGSGPSRAICIAAALSGAAGLVVQVAWIRRLAPVVGNTTYAFATVLGTWLLALALGPLLFGPRRGIGPTNKPAWLLAVAAIPVVLLPPVLAFVGDMTAQWIGNSDPGWLEMLGLRTAAAAILLVPSTLLGAAGLPWLLRAAAPDRQSMGRGAGRLLAWNTAGSAVWALLTALLWLPAIGSAAALRGAGGLYLASAACVAPARWRALPLVLACALWVQPWVMQLEDDALFDTVGASFSPTEFGLPDAPRLLAREGRMATIVVRDREGDRELWVDSKIVASTAPTDLLHLTLLGHLPMALHPDPKRVAVIGLGTGITSTCTAAWEPDVLDIFELEREVPNAATFFEADGGGVPSRANVSIEDGRHALLRRDVRYDVITCDPIHPGVAGSASLYSKEHYELMRDRADLICQWLPLYQMTVSDVRLVVRTFAAVYPATYVFLAGPDAILIGAAQPLQLDEARLRASLARPAAASLADFGLRSPGRLLGLLAQGPAGARVFAGDGPLNTDDRLLLEFECGRHWYVNEVQKNALFLRLDRAPARSLLAAAPTATFEQERRHADQIRDALRIWLDANDDERALDEMDEVRKAAPGRRFWEALRVELLLDLGYAEYHAGDKISALGRAREVLRTEGVGVAPRLDACELLIRLGSTGEARRQAAKIAAAHPYPRAIRLAGPSGE
jgi:predicted membrane-bound spermidine synthase